MSIHPKFARLILEGKKKVEFRRTSFAFHVSYVVIYATTPIKKVVGYFEVKRIQVANPEELWQLYSDVGGIEHQVYQNYYNDLDKGFAIEVGRVYQLNNFLSLDCISTSLIAPQSYMYLDKNLFNSIRLNQNLF
ncbi:ASCH domain-containing protein [Oculatella sp. FACHB-28]|nr:ASCH domain-containing protein [Oculatella sp. FACHB-28]